MDALQTIVGVLDSMGPALVSGIVILVALILIWLIIRASRRSAGADKTVKPEVQRSRYGTQPEEGHQIKAEDHAAAARKVQAEQAGFKEELPVQPAVKPSAAVEPPAAMATEVSPEPEDSVLHRHYEAEQEAKKEALAHPYPTDSVLRRHYDTLHKIQLDAGTQKPAAVGEVASATKLAATTATTPGIAPVRSSKASIIEQAIRKDSQGATPPAVTAKPVGHTVKLALPQDSVLKRHFISQLQAEIAAGFSPRPSDSVLKRHYDALIQSELEKRLLI